MIKPDRKCVGVRALLRSGSLFFFQPAVLCEPELNSRFCEVLLNPFSPVFKVLEDSRQILVAANMRPDDPFPMDDKIKEGLAHFPSSLCRSEALFSSRSLHSSRAWPSCVTDPFFLFSSCACSDISFLLSFLCVLSPSLQHIHTWWRTRLFLATWCCVSPASSTTTMTGTLNGAACCAGGSISVTRQGSSQEGPTSTSSHW